MYSARFAGEPKSDAANNAKLLSELGGLVGEERSAHSLLLVLAAPNSESLVVQAECPGQIATLPAEM